MNPARPAPGVALARVDEIENHGAIVRDFAEGEARFSMILAREDERITGYVNRCPHAGSPLERFDGRVLVLGGRYLLCAAHGAQFTMENGACVAGPGTGRPLTPVPILVEAGVIRMGR